MHFLYLMLKKITGTQISREAHLSISDTNTLLNTLYTVTDEKEPRAGGELGCAPSTRLYGPWNTSVHSATGGLRVW